MTLLTDAGVVVDRDALTAACPLDVSAPEGMRDAGGSELLWRIGSRLIDADRVLGLLAATLEQVPSVLPDWIGAGANPDDVAEIAADWRRWYEGHIARQVNADLDSWVDDRLEYRFALGIDRPGGQLVLHAPAFGGGRIDWHDLEHEAGAIALAPPEGVAPGVTHSRATTVHASPLRFSGMPAERYWQFEDGAVNLAAVEAQPHDLARLMLLEYAMVFGNDWLVVPLDLPLGSFTTLDSVAYTDTFGERTFVAQADDSVRSGRFRLFEMSLKDEPGTSIDGLFLPPVAIGVQEGPPREEVLFLRDEMANMAWAVERLVEGPSGELRNRSDERRPAPYAHIAGSAADLEYLMATTVPANWIPFVPIADAGGVALQKGAMISEGQKVMSLGVLLEPTPLVVRNEEIPREGVRVQRVPMLARRVDGSYARWTTRRVSVGTGEGASRLAFDSAIPRPR